MKIAFIIDQVYLHGGIERVLSIKANYFASQKEHEVYIITTEQKKQNPCYLFNDNVIFKDLEVNYNRKKSYFHPVNLLKLPGHIRKTRSALKKINPEVVVVCSHSVDTYFVPFIFKNVPKLKEFHYSRFIEKNKRTSSSFFKKLFFKFTDYVETKYDRLIILNKDESAYYKSNNIQVIPNPLTFYPDTVSDLSNKRCITAGRIAPVKGYDILIDIWKELKETGWNLDIYGSGVPEYVQKLQGQIDELNLGDTVTLKGSTDKIQKEMLDSSVFLMTSHNECFPLVLLEAQACGLPIVSFDCPYGPRNIIDETTGILVTMYENERFADQLKELMNQPETIDQKGKNARDNADKYRLETIMTQWETMFNDITSVV
ncbi:glycosyltransferase family 4 protein [Aquimarina macrocephali]|uniref:glycosyltransferase family 4 protein n=1 Tax=Aquimarina macrocephali TaxID=666563 RepID=UPI000463448C|nr:glycosyltransferase family 4 protein [Aquimarina macrocephali]